MLHFLCQLFAKLRGVYLIICFFKIRDRKGERPSETLVRGIISSLSKFLLRLFVLYIISHSNSRQDKLLRLKNYLKILQLRKDSGNFLNSEKYFFTFCMLTKHCRGLKFNRIACFVENTFNSTVFHPDGFSYVFNCALISSLVSWLISPYQPRRQL